MKQMSDYKVIELMRQSFIASTRYYRLNRYTLKHVLQQIDDEAYLPEWEFVRLLKKAGYGIKATQGMHYKVKVWVIPNERVNKALWGYGNELKYLGN